LSQGQPLPQISQRFISNLRVIQLTETDKKTDRHTHKQTKAEDITAVYNSHNNVYLDAKTLRTPFSSTTQIGFQPNRRTFWMTIKHTIQDIQQLIK